MQTAAQHTCFTKPAIHEHETRSIAGGAALTLAGRIVAGSVQYLYVLVAAKFLGIADFGLLMLSLTVINLAGIISRLGLDVGVIRYITIHSRSGNEADIKGTILQSLMTALAASTFVGILLFLFSDTLCTSLFNKPGLAGPIKLLAVSLPFFTVMSVALGITRGFHIMKFTVYTQDLFYPLCNLLLAAALLVTGHSLFGAAFAYIVAVVLASLLAVWFVVKTFPFRPGIKAVYTGELFHFSLPLMFTVLLHSIVTGTDTLMLGCFKTADEVGIYNVCAKTAVLTGAVLVSFNTIFTPMVSDLCRQGQINKLGDMFKLITRWIYSISLPFFLLIVLLARDILAVFGDDYTVGRYPMIMLALAQLVFAGTGSTAVVLAMSGRQYIVMFNTIAVCILNIVLNYCLIPPYGIMGAAAATGISIIVSNIGMLICVYGTLRIHPYNRRFIRITLLNLAAFAAAVGAHHCIRDFGSIQKLAILIPFYLLLDVLLCMKWAFYDEDRYIIQLLRTRLKMGTAE